MAIELIVNFSKRLGLPGYSSPHQFSVSVETEPLWPISGRGDKDVEQVPKYMLN